MRLYIPRSTPPPRPEILFSLAEPPARILASRLSLRIRACSETLEDGASEPGDEDGMGGVSAILMSWVWYANITLGEAFCLPGEISEVRLSTNRFSEARTTRQESFLDRKSGTDFQCSMPSGTFKSCHIECRFFYPS